MTIEKNFVKFELFLSFFGGVSLVAGIQKYYIVAVLIIFTIGIAYSVYLSIKTKNYQVKTDLNPDNKSGLYRIITHSSNEVKSQFQLTPLNYRQIVAIESIGGSVKKQSLIEHFSVSFSFIALFISSDIILNWVVFDNGFQKLLHRIAAYVLIISTTILIESYFQKIILKYLIAQMGSIQRSFSSKRIVTILTGIFAFFFCTFFITLGAQDYELEAFISCLYVGLIILVLILHETHSDQAIERFFEQVVSENETFYQKQEF